jgi:hypothetical protein
MVRLAPMPPSRSLQGPPETEDATVMLSDKGFVYEGNVISELSRSEL